MQCIKKIQKLCPSGYLCSGILLNNVVKRQNIHSIPALNDFNQHGLVGIHQFLHGQCLSTNRKGHLVFQCWKCHKNIEEFVFKCQFCSALQAPRSEICYFNLFNEDIKYDINTTQLRQKFLRLQAEYHPDKFSTKEDKEKLISEEISSIINKAYSTLLNPYERGLYMLQINNVSLDESEIQLDAAFLGKIMDLNEEVEDIKSKNELNNFETRNSLEIDQLMSEVSSALSGQDYKSAKLSLQRMKYFISIRNRLKSLKAVLTLKKKNFSF